MGYLLTALLVLGVLYIGSGRFAQADPRKLAAMLRKSARWIGAAALVVVAGWLLLRGQWGAIFMLAPLAIPKVRHWWRNWLAQTPTPGQQSEVQTSWFDMRLNHGSGALEGVIRQGEHQGRSLANLTETELFALWRIVALDDPPSAQLLEAWLDRALGGDWRDRAMPQDTPPSSAGSGPLDRAEALRILGLEEPVSEAAIREAHHRLMLANHPDRGGSPYLAAKINQARDILLAKAG